MKARSFGTMNRRAAILWISAASGFGSAVAQTRKPVARVGYLALANNERLQAALRTGLAQHGLLEGSNLVFLDLSAENRPDTLDEAALRLVALAPDVIVTVGNAATRAAARATRTVPIIFAPTGDALRTGLVRTLARPEANLTGLSLDTWELNAKRLEAMRESFREVRRVAVLSNYGNPSGEAQWEMTQRGAQALGLETTLTVIIRRDHLSSALADVARSKPDALHVVSDAVFDAAREQIVAFAAAHSLPAIYEHRAFTEAGGLMSYGPNLDKVSARAGWYAARVLDGARPSDLPVEQPTQFELVVNLRAAKAANIEISPLVLARADEVIE